MLLQEAGIVLRVLRVFPAIVSECFPAARHREICANEEMTSFALPCYWQAETRTRIASLLLTTNSVMEFVKRNFRIAIKVAIRIGYTFSKNQWFFQKMSKCIDCNTFNWLQLVIKKELTLK